MGPEALRKRFDLDASFIVFFFAGGFDKEADHSCTIPEHPSAHVITDIPSGPPHVGALGPGVVRFTPRVRPGPRHGGHQLQCHVRPDLVRSGLPHDMLQQVAQVRGVGHRGSRPGVRRGGRDPEASGLQGQAVRRGGLRPSDSRP